MKVCKKCGNENPDNLASCKFCNKPFPLSGTIVGKSSSSSIPTPGGIPSIPPGPLSPPPSPPYYPPKTRTPVPYSYVLPSLYKIKYGLPDLQGTVQEVKDRRVNQKDLVPLILGGLMALKNILYGLSMMYFGSNKEVIVTVLVIKNEHTGKEKEANLYKPQGSFPGIGNHLSLYGTEKNGVLIVKRGYNHDTTSELICN